MRRLLRAARSSSGSALIVVIFTLLILSALTASLIGQTRTELLTGRNMQINVQNELLAEAGVYAALVKLADPQDTAPFTADGRPYELITDAGRVEVRVQNEAGKINVNRMPNPLLLKLLQASCLSAAQAETTMKAIEDYVTGEAPGKSANAAEAGAPKAGKLASADELKRVSGVGEALFDRIEPYVSSYSFKEQPDYLLAPDKLKSLIHNGSTVQAGAPFSEEQRQASARPSGAVAGVFAISAAASGGGAQSVVKAIIYVTGDKASPYRVLEWWRDAGTPDRGCEKTAEGR